LLKYLKEGLKMHIDLRKNLSRAGLLLSAATIILPLTLLAQSRAPSTAAAVSPSAEVATLTKAANLNPSGRPGNVPSDYVITPKGYFSRSCVIHVDSNEVVHGDGTITRIGGGTRTPPPCNQPSYTRTGELLDRETLRSVAPASSAAMAPALSAASTPAIGAQTRVVALKAETESWYGATLNPGRITQSYTIPLKPPMEATIFYWPAFDAGALQPVLGWENGEWTISSWGYFNHAYHKANMYVAYAGDKVETDIYSTCPPGTVNCSNWVIDTRDLTTGKTSKLVFTGGGVTGPVALLVEMYGSACGDFPPDESVVFHDIVVWDFNFKRVPIPSWSDWMSATECNAFNLKSTPTTVKLSY
jgi:hypothetical protein